MLYALIVRCAAAIVSHRPLTTWALCSGVLLLSGCNLFSTEPSLHAEVGLVSDDVGNTPDTSDVARNFGTPPVDAAADVTTDTSIESDGAAQAVLADVDGLEDVGDMLGEDVRAPLGCPGYASLMPIAYWSLDEPDPFGNYPPDYAALEVTNLRLVGAPSPTAGVHRGGVSFDGVDDGLVFDHAAAFETADGTVALWFRMPDPASGSQSVPIAKDGEDFGEGGHFRILVQQGFVELRLQDQDSDYFAVSTTELQPDTWYHVITTFGSAGIRLYLDGALEASGTYTGGLFEAGSLMNTEPGSVGASNHYSPAGTPTPLGDHFRGEIDEVVFFDYQLTAEQAQDLHQFCTP